MKNLLIIGLTPPMEGGSQQHILEIVKNLDQKFFNVTVVTQKGTLCSKYSHCIELDLENGGGYRQSFEFYKKVKNIISSFGKYNIIHLHENYLSLLIPLIKRHSRAKILLTVHGLKGFRYFDNKLIWAFFKKRMKQADRLIAVSKPDEQILRKNFPNLKIVQIPNGVDTSIYKSSKKIEKRITFIGRIHEQKGLIYLLEAFDNASKKYPDFRLEIIGKENEYSELLKKRFPNPKIVYKGYQNDRKKIASLLSSSYALALPSLWEGSPLTLFESLASGRPVIASDIPAFKDILTDEKDGILVPAKDSNELAENIIYLIKNKSLASKIGNAGKKLAMEYDWKQISKRTEKVYLQ